MRLSSSSKKGKRSKPATKFPKIYRFFPEKIAEEYVFSLGVACILISGLIVGLDLYSNLSAQKKLISQKTELESQQVFWQNEVNNHPNYRDGYFGLALVEYQLRDFEASKNNLDKALSIDPNFEKGRALQKLLSQDL